MSTDTIRLLFTYGIAAGAMIALFALLFVPTPEIEPQAKLALVTTNLGLVLGWALNKESATGGARAAERAVAQGANAGVIPEKKD